MFREIDAAPGERVLLLGSIEMAVVEHFARAAAEGIVVGLGDSEPVAAARRAMATYENVMFVPATPDEIPWREGFFTLVVAPPGSWAIPEVAVAEVARVLAPGGRLVCGGDEPVALLEAGGFTRAGRWTGGPVWRRT